MTAWTQRQVSQVTLHRLLVAWLDNQPRCIQRDRCSLNAFPLSEGWWIEVNSIVNDSRVKWEHNNLTRNDWSRVMVRSVERGQNSRLWVAIHHLSYKSKMKTKKNLSQKEIERRQYQSSIDKLQSDTSIERIKEQEKSKLLAFTLAIVILCICIMIGYSIFISYFTV